MQNIDRLNMFNVVYECNATPVDGRLIGICPEMTWTNVALHAQMLFSVHWYFRSLVPNSIQQNVCLKIVKVARHTHTHTKSLKAKERERMLLNSWKFFGTRMGMRVRFQWIFPCNTFRFRAVFFSLLSLSLVGFEFYIWQKGHTIHSTHREERATCLHSMLNRWRVYSFIRLQHNDFEIEFATDKTGNGKALCNTENNVTICLLMDPVRCSSNGKHERNITTLRFDSIAQWNIPAMKFYTSTPLLAFIAAPVNRERERKMNMKRVCVKVRGREWKGSE